VRFELLTDGSTTLQGLLLDDISIPEINYSTDAESGDDNWQAEGWIRMDNTLPQTYLVQMIEYGATPPSHGCSTLQMVCPVSGM